MSPTPEVPACGWHHRYMYYLQVSRGGEYPLAYYYPGSPRILSLPSNVPIRVPATYESENPGFLTRGGHESFTIVF